MIHEPLVADLLELPPEGIRLMAPYVERWCTGRKPRLPRNAPQVEAEMRSLSQRDEGQSGAIGRPPSMLCG